MTGSTVKTVAYDVSSVAQISSAFYYSNSQLDFVDPSKLEVNGLNTRNINFAKRVKHPRRAFLAF